MTDIIEILPWGALMLVFAGQLVLNLRLVAAISTALKDVSQALGIPAPALQPAKSSSPIVSNTLLPSPAIVKPTAPSPVIDQALIDFIKKTEGFSAKAYGDFKQWSIGYGTRALSENETITEPDAYARLMAELAQVSVSVEAFAPDAPKGVKQALIDLTYNAGTTWQKQGLGTAIKNKDYADAKERIKLYNHAGGEVSAGLTARREAEASWFDNPL